MIIAEFFNKKQSTTFRYKQKKTKLRHAEGNIPLQRILVEVYIYVFVKGLGNSKEQSLKNK